MSDQAVIAGMVAEPEREMDHRERVALQKLGSPAGFRFYQWEAVGPVDGPRDCLLTGCVVTRTYSKGRRKGEPVYDGTPMRVVVTESEVKVERARYESETGKCGECLGRGKVLASWSVTDGVSYRDCRLCGGAGKVVAA